MKKSQKQKRDNFSSATIKKLKEMVGDVCSHPECRVVTGGSKFLGENTFSIGVAAHICAAAPGGPRYDSNMTSEQRSSYENGIWLCQTHARMIDADISRFPKNLLLTWRKDAEQLSTQRVGARLLTPVEQERALRIAVGRSIADFIEDRSIPVIDVIDGYERNLEELDPRFDVKLLKDEEGVITHVITPKNGEKAGFNINFSTPKAISSLRRLIDYGEDASFDFSDFTITGSKLFEGIPLGKSGQLTIGSHKRHIEVSVSLLVDDDESELASFKCTVSSGTKRALVQGNAYNGLLSFRMEIDEGTDPKISISFHPERWLGIDVSRLGYFPRISKLADRMRKTGVMRVAIDVTSDNKTSRVGSGDLDENKEFSSNVLWYVELIKAARKISEKFVDPIFIKTFDIAQDEEDMIFRYAELIDGEVKGKPILNHEFCRGKFSPEGKIAFAEGGANESHVVQFIEDDGKFFSLLGNQIKPPPVHVQIENCAVRSPSDSNGSVDADSFIVIAEQDTTFTMRLDEAAVWVLDSED